MDKVNKILDDLFCIIAIIIFPMCILKLLGYTEIVKKGGIE